MNKRTVQLEIGDKKVGGEYLTIRNENESDVLIQISNSPTLVIEANLLVEQINYVMNREGDCK